MIVKVLIMLVGLGFTIANAIPGFTNNDKKKLKKAALIFFSTWVVLVLVSVLEFALFY